jgi:hypothetical protein
MSGLSSTMSFRLISFPVGDAGKGISGNDDIGGGPVGVRGEDRLHVGKGALLQLIGGGVLVRDLHVLEEADEVTSSSTYCP